MNTLSTIKKALKKTPIYTLRQYYRKNKLSKKWRLEMSVWTEHDQEMLEFYSQFISPTDLVFDVGANIGNRTKIFLKLGAKVVAIEPQDECVKNITASFGKNKNLTILQSVLGASNGVAELMICNTNTISSMSTTWIEAVKSSGRFTNYNWDSKKNLKMTTLDELVDTYGMPSFIKIDVEGFEYEVLRGLSYPANSISLEFTPEVMASTFKCIEYLKGLGDVRFNYSLYEEVEFVLDEFVSAKKIVSIIETYRHDHKVFGDVYCQFVDEKSVLESVHGTKTAVATKVM